MVVASLVISSFSPSQCHSFAGLIHCRCNTVCRHYTRGASFRTNDAARSYSQAHAPGEHVPERGEGPSAGRSSVHSQHPAVCPKTNLKYVILFLFYVGNMVKKHSGLRAEMVRGPCTKVLVSMLQAASEYEEVCTKSFCLEYICLAQCNLGIACEPFWQNLAAVPLSRIEQQPSTTTCSIVHAYAQLREANAVPLHSERFIQLQHSIVHCHWKEWNASSVSNVALSMSMQGELRSATLEKLRRASLRTAALMYEQQVADTLWAFANMNVGLGEAQESLMHALLRVVDSMDAPNVGNTLWACAKMNLDFGEAKGRLLNAAIRISDRMSAQSVGYTMWALAKLRFTFRDAPRPLLRAVKRVSNSKNAQAVANTLWGCAKLNFRIYETETLRDAVPKVCHRMSGDDVAYTMWAYACKQWCLREAREPLMRAAARVFNRTTSQNVACILWACSHITDDFFVPERHLMMNPLRTSTEMNSPKVVKVLWMLSQLEIQPGFARPNFKWDIPKDFSDLSAEEVEKTRCGIEWLHKEGYSDEGLKAALKNLNEHIA
jgi:hypothetical protein